MATVDPVFAQWLQSAALWHVEESTELAARWGDAALTTERLTTIASKSDAEAEAVRQLAFMGPPAVIDEHLLMGEWAAYLGSVLTLTSDQLGYELGVEVFVIGVEDDRAVGTSRVTVIRRL